MKILVITLNAWNTTNSTGNTISNLFSGLSESDDVANIYCRYEPIDNNICAKYFRVTEKEILRNVLSPWRCGKLVSKDNNDASGNKTSNRYKSVVTFSRHHTSLLLLREIIWSIPVWKNRSLNHFLKDFEPDCIYMHGHYNLYMHKLLDYCAEVTNAKTVLFWGDDMYGRKNKRALGYLYESLLRKRFRKTINKASLLFGGSIKLCEEYTSIFGKSFIPFFKECKQVGYNENKQVGCPITLVYAGNLLFGREKMMIELVKSLSRINRKHLSRQFILKVFSSSIPSKELLYHLDNSDCCEFVGRKPYDEVCAAMDVSDLALFIESFDKHDILSTRLSFSTKIIDCMQSSSSILAIGPREIASIDYIEKNKIGFVITDLSSMDSSLEYIADHPEIIKERNLLKAKFAKENHMNTSVKALNEIKKIL